MFVAELNNYGCIKIDTKDIQNLYLNEQDFETKLKESISNWVNEGVRGVWFKIRTEHVSLLHTCIQNNFTLHHTQPDYIMLKLWLLKSEPDSLPTYATHYIGAGGFVINDKNEMLVVKERFNTAHPWKLPGGHVNAGENVEEAACREVYEETGVTCRSNGIICFRQMHNYRFGCSDIYFVCLLKPVTHDISIDSLEISDCRWIPVDEFISDSRTSPMNRFVAELYRDKLRDAANCIQSSEVLAFNRLGMNVIHHPPLNKPSNSSSLSEANL